jgi:signal peptidase I
MFILKKLYSLFLDLLQTFVLAGALFVVIYAFLFRPYQVNGQSMYPNFENGEYVLTNIISFRLNNQLPRGTVIVFQAPPDREKDYIKRIIGLPGDKILIKNGSVYVNGELLDESAYLPDDFKTYGQRFLPDDKEITVPQNHYFVLGDNRDFSSDSRDWGFVSFDKVIGISMLVYWPPQRARIVKTPAYHLSSNQ